MNKKLLLIVFLVPSLHSMAQIEEYTMPDGKVVKIDRSVFPNLRYDVSSKPQPADYVARRKARAKQGGIELPPFVNNGQDKYFPPIFNQDGGSCGSAQPPRRQDPNACSRQPLRGRKERPAISSSRPPRCRRPIRQAT